MGVLSDVVSELIEMVRADYLNFLALTAFPSGVEQEANEEAEREPLDTIADDEDIGDEVDNEIIRERTMLEEIPPPGIETGEAERKQQWLNFLEQLEPPSGGCRFSYWHALKEHLIEALRATGCPP